MEFSRGITTMALRVSGGGRAMGGGRVHIGLPTPPQPPEGTS